MQSLKIKCTNLEKVLSNVCNLSFSPHSLQLTKQRDEQQGTQKKSPILLNWLIPLSS
jgi:hypothetical protein